jgi:hypothetical protein
MSKNPLDNYAYHMTESCHFLPQGSFISISRFWINVTMRMITKIPSFPLKIMAFKSRIILLFQDEIQSTEQNVCATF